MRSEVDCTKTPRSLDASGPKASRLDRMSDCSKTHSGPAAPVPYEKPGFSDPSLENTDSHSTQFNRNQDNEIRSPSSTSTVRFESSPVPLSTASNTASGVSNTASVSPSGVSCSTPSSIILSNQQQNFQLQKQQQQRCAQLRYQQQQQQHHQHQHQIFNKSEREVNENLQLSKSQDSRALYRQNNESTPGVISDIANDYIKQGETETRISPIEEFNTLNRHVNSVRKSIRLKESKFV